LIRTLIATFAVLLLGVAAFAGLTHGFTTLTAETARRQAVAVRPIAIPDLSGVDQLGLRRPMIDAADDRVAIVDFIFTRCTSICLALGDSYQRLQSQILSAHLERRLRLVTVSFDPEHDTPAIIADYAERMRVNPAVWTVLTPSDPAQLRAAMSTFGVIAKPAQLGQFVHNAAFNIVDRHGRLARIVPIDQPRLALDAAREIDSRP
jgi:protein SCO1/2